MEILKRCYDKASGLLFGLFAFAALLFAPGGAFAQADPPVATDFVPTWFTADWIVSLGVFVGGLIITMSVIGMVIHWITGKRKVT